MSKYVQCHFAKGNIRYSPFWIPKDKAIIGKVISFKQDDGTWEEGITITSVGDIELDEKYVRDHEQNYKRTRQASDR